MRISDWSSDVCSSDLARAKAAGADLIVYPELQLIGYPPEDLVLKPALAERAKEGLQRLAGATADGGPAMLVGTIHKGEDGLLYSAMALLDGGKGAGGTLKHELPNYGTCDEKRVFAPGPLPGPLNIRGVRIGIPICEDMWFPHVTQCLAETGAEILVVPNGSPFEIDKEIGRAS